MNEILQALTAIPVEISEKTDDAQWVHIVPSGTSVGYDGRGPYVLKDAEAVITASKRPKTDMVMDRDHEIYFSPPGTKITAAAWFKDFEAREDGIWGLVEWTPFAAYQLSVKEYRYLSPVFAFKEETGEITQIHHVSLTNTPNLEMTAVASALINSQPNQKKEENTMNKHLVAIAAALGLATTATPEEIVTAAQNAVTTSDQLKTDYASVTQALGIDDNADNATVVAAASQAIAAPAGNPDPSAFVPMSVHTELSTRLSTLQKTVEDDRSATAVASAMTAGKISPAQKDWATAYASKDPEGFASYVEAAPKIVGDATAPAGAREGGAAKLSDEDVAVAQQLGISQEDFSKTGNKEEAA